MYMLIPCKFHTSRIVVGFQYLLHSCILKAVDSYKGHIPDVINSNSYLNLILAHSQYIHKMVNFLQICEFLTIFTFTVHSQDSESPPNL